MHLNVLIYNLRYAMGQLKYAVTNNIAYFILFFINIFYQILSRTYDILFGKKPIELNADIINITDLTSSTWYEVARNENNTQRLKSSGVFNFIVNPANEHQLYTILVSIDIRTQKPILFTLMVGYLYNKDNTKWYNISSMFPFAKDINVPKYPKKVLEI